MMMDGANSDPCKEKFQQNDINELTIWQE